MATEEYLLDHLTPEERVLYLWQSNSAVVIGKNQNPWMECSIPLLRKDGVKLARRLSGGGTVYQDVGNLNFTFFAFREFYSVMEQAQIIISALKKKGILLSYEEGHKLTVNGRKSSGNAFCFRKDKAFHHGTLLISADLKKMERYLQPSGYHITTRAVSSKRTIVGNLSDTYLIIDCKEVINLIIESFVKFYGTKLEIFNDPRVLNSKEIQKLYRKYKSWEWIFGNTPKFHLHLKKHFSWGECSLLFNVEKGRIIRIESVGDNLNSYCKKLMNDKLLGYQFTSSGIADKIRHHVNDQGKGLPLYGIADWFEEMNF